MDYQEQLRAKNARHLEEEEAAGRGPLTVLEYENRQRIERWRVAAAEKRAYPNGRPVNFSMLDRVLGRLRRWGGQKLALLNLSRAVLLHPKHRQQ